MGKWTMLPTLVPAITTRWSWAVVYVIPLYSCHKAADTLCGSVAITLRFHVPTGVREGSLVASHSVAGPVGRLKVVSSSSQLRPEE